MKTKIIDNETGEQYIIRDLPLLHEGMAISLTEAFGLRRVHEVWLEIGANESERSQTIIIGIKD